jgi:exodeoxyribonuclease VIII
MKIEQLLPNRIVEDMPAAVYHAVDALGSSTLRKVLSASPAHAVAAIRNREETASQRLGTALHAALLEPAKFAAQIAIAPECDRRTKDGKAVWEAFQLQAEGRTVITADQGESLAGMVEAVKASKAAAGLLRMANVREVSVFATDPLIGLPIKARLDAWAPGDRGEFIVDIKTTSGLASRSEFERTLASYGYGAQAAFYMRVARAAGLKVSEFIFIAVETSDPYGVGCYALDEEIVALFEPEVDRAIEAWAVAKRGGVFRAYPDEVQKLGAPKWLRRQLEEGVAA